MFSILNIYDIYITYDLKIYYKIYIQYHLLFKNIMQLVYFNFIDGST